MIRLLAAAFAALALAGCSREEEAEQPGPISRFTLYYLDGEQLRATPATSRNAGATPFEVIQRLLANEDEHETEIPPATTLNGVVVSDRTATVDLSRAFEAGGGSASMQARVAQVVYTLTQWRFVRRVTIELDGEPVQGIGGEGIPARELARADFESVLPPIFLDPPLTQASSPLRVRGSASIFEASVSFRLEADGRMLANGFTTAAEGAPGRGAFSAMLEFEVDAPTEATLVAFEVSANDGSETNVVRVPVRLCPSARARPC